MLARIFVLAGIVLAAAVAVSPAQALTMQQCSAKYKAAQTAGTLNGMKWNDFRKANCGPTASATPTASSSAATSSMSAASGEPTVANTENAAEPKAPAANVAVPRGVPFPKAIASKYGSETPAKGRMHTCLDQYRLNKTNNALGGLKWIQKGGGYYSLCNARLKS